VAETKFNWWQQEIKQLFSGTAQHPITQALQPVIQAHSLDQSLFLDLIAGIKKNAEYNAYHSAAELIQHAHRASHAKMQLLATVFGHKHASTLEFAHDLGIGLALFESVYTMRKDLQKGNVYFPTEDLQKFDLTANKLLDTSDATAVNALLRLQDERITTFFQKALKHLEKSEHYKQRSLLIEQRLTTALLDLLKPNLAAVLSAHIQLTPLKKLYIAWRTVRNAKKYS